MSRVKLEYGIEVEVEDEWDDRTLPPLVHERRDVRVCVSMLRGFFQPMHEDKHDPDLSEPGKLPWRPDRVSMVIDLTADQAKQIGQLLQEAATL